MTPEKMTTIKAINEKYNIGRIWKEKRLYINGLYNTKKCKQTAYIDLSTFQVHCFTDCPTQTLEWCEWQNERVVNGHASFARLLRIATKSQQFNSEPIEVVMHNAVLDAQDVIGYYTEWREVSVTINRFGKRAIRNRQFVVAFKGTKATAPRGFVELSQVGYDHLVDCYKGEHMLEPCMSVPDYEALKHFADAYAERMTKEREEQEAAQQKKQQEEKERKQEQLKKLDNAVAAGVDMLKAWKLAGCPHPAPVEVVKAKNESGLGWNAFSATISE